MLTDLSADDLAGYRSDQVDPPGFDEFWAGTIAEARALGRTAAPLSVAPVDSGLLTVDVYDVVFPGFAGEPIRAWLRVPAGSRAAHSLAAVVQFAGYGGGRGRPWGGLFWASAGFAHLQMDTRGQGSGWSAGATGDPWGAGPQAPGVMTRGIGHPRDYYYRRLITDAVRAVDATAGIPLIDPRRVAVVGHSQGGGLALAVVSLLPSVRAAAFATPFLCDFPRALAVTDAYPYREIVDHVAVHREAAAAVLETLSFVDGVNFARRARVPAYFSAALMDAITPPSTIAGARNAYAGPSELRLWPFNGHEGGGPDEDAAMLEFLRPLLSLAGQKP